MEHFHYYPEIKMGPREITFDYSFKYYSIVIRIENGAITSRAIMGKYKISGVWKDTNDVITHYAFHTVKEDFTTRAHKMAKSKAISLLEEPGNSAITWVWNYRTAKWNNGETVQVVNGRNGKYLRSDPDNTLTDNLAHLIDYDWISP